MRYLLLIAPLAALLALASASAEAGKKHGHGHDDDGHGRHGHHDRGKHEGWRKGERIDVVYLQPRYHVSDYRVYHLAPPPRGHRWVRGDDGKFILVAVATGIIADILLHH
ncbi:RcnB family protein [Lysobacter koreensis]|uniref:RcnB family protein n=1 Tax=Lysobacter koreensis TaxID=266122 RepID=A0ABW2YRR0_9GAMM